MKTLCTLLAGAILAGCAPAPKPLVRYPPVKSALAPEPLRESPATPEAESYDMTPGAAQVPRKATTNAWCCAVTAYSPARLESPFSQTLAFMNIVGSTNPPGWAGNTYYGAMPSISFAWDPVLGASGYNFYLAGPSCLYSNMWDVGPALGFTLTLAKPGVPPVWRHAYLTNSGGQLQFTANLVKGPWVPTNNPLFVTNFGPPFLRGRSTNGQAGKVTTDRVQ